MDITLQVMLRPATHDLSYDPAKEARRLRRGDILRVHTTTDIAVLVNDKYQMDLAPDLNWGYVHIRDVPDARAARMKDVLTRMSGETKSRESIHPATGETVIDQLMDNHRKRKWRVKITMMGQGARDKLLNEGQITVNWVAFRDKIRRKVPIGRLTPNTDTDTPVLDGDL